MSVAAAEEVNVVAPPTVKAPVVCVSPPVTVPAPVIIAKSPPTTLDVPKMSALASVTATALAPVLFKLTAPVKSFAAWVNVIVAPPVVIVDVPLIESVPPA